MHVQMQHRMINIIQNKYFCNIWTVHYMIINRNNIIKIEMIFKNSAKFP